MSELSLTQFKRCTKCSATKPRTSEFFSKDVRNRDGLGAQCLICVRIRGLNHYHDTKRPEASFYGGGIGLHPQAWLEFESGLWCRQCAGCDSVLPLLPQYFSRDSKSRTGLKSRCRSCRAAETKVYALTHPEWKLDYDKTYNELHRERLRRKYWENRDEHLARSRAYEAVNQDKRKAYRQANKEKWAEYHRNRRALIRGAEGKHTASEIRQMLEDQGHVCAYCEVPLFGEFHVDHMLPLSRGGSNDWSNLAITCDRCNRSKHNKTTEEFMDGLRGRVT